MENYGVHIDARNRKVGIVSWVGDGFKGMKGVLGISTAEPVDLVDGIITLWVDENGRGIGDQVWFKFDGRLFAGSAMVVFGKYVSPLTRDLDAVRQVVEFIDAETLSEDDTEPQCGFIGSLAEADAAIAAGNLPAHMRAFFE